MRHHRSLEKTASILGLVTALSAIAAVIGAPLWSPLLKGSEDRLVVITHACFVG